MFPYFALFGFFAIGALLSPPDWRRGKPFGGLLLAALVLIVMIGLRYKVGMDWTNYLRAWRLAHSVSASGLIERYNGDPGFYGLTSLLASTGRGYWLLNLACAAIFSWGLVAFARTLPDPWLAITVAVPYLIIAIAMSGIRQASAIGFIFLALVALTGGRTRGFVGWTVVAATFHASAILVIPFVGLAVAKNRLQAVALLVVIGVAGYYLLGSNFERYSSDYATSKLQSSGTIFRVVMSAAAAVVFLFFISKRLEMSDQERALWRNFSLVALASVPLMTLVESTTVLDRVLLYLFPLQVYALSVFPALQEQARHRLFLKIGVLVYLAIMLTVFLNFADNAHGYLPYRFYDFENTGGLAR